MLPQKRRFKQKKLHYICHSLILEVYFPHGWLYSDINTNIRSYLLIDNLACPMIERDRVSVDTRQLVAAPDTSNRTFVSDFALFLSCFVI